MQLDQVTISYVWKIEEERIQTLETDTFDV